MGDYRHGEDHHDYGSMIRRFLQCEEALVLRSLLSLESGLHATALEICRHSHQHSITTGYLS